MSQTPVIQGGSGRVHVRVRRGKILTRQLAFDTGFTLGRGDGCDVQFADENVSTGHASVLQEGNLWWLEDLASTNGTFIGGNRITGRVPLPLKKDVHFGRKGPVVLFVLEEQPASPAPGGPERRIGRTQVIRRYFEGTAGGRVGDRTLLIREAFRTVRRRYRLRYWIAIGAVTALLLLAVLAIVQYRARIEQLQKLHATAAEVFYTTKSLELQLAKLRAEVEKTNDVKFREELREKREEQEALQVKYIDFLDELGISREKLSQEDWLIYRVARLFGECDVSMPAEFLEKVKEYIRFWQRGHRLVRAVERARRQNLAPVISSTLLSCDLPPQFFYLAVQESGLDTLECGPETRSGIAKGMWQFIPATAWKYGLQTGPLIDIRKADPHDERHAFRKSTEAAAHYLRDLYDTEAQASGLLVMACYNWDENKIREMLSTMPENPRQRNFWNLLARHTLPEETYNYVFYIVSAAVIGENPRLFGFDFDRPLADLPPDSTVGGHFSR
ncbi:MAG TPA: FHA domain-containing protein [Bacteroidota bacterium]|nr:FHA domain-containing protein [Bacteroidota bacterium]